MPPSPEYSPEDERFPEVWFVSNTLRGVTYRRPLIVGYVSLQTFLPHRCFAIHGVVEGSHRRLCGAEL